MKLIASFLLLTFLFSCGKDKPIPDTNINYTPDYTFEWVLSELPDAADVAGIDYVDVDGFEASKELVSAIQANGSKVIGYISVGSWEDWRSDKDDFPSSIIGNKYDGWAGERWLDIGNLDLIKGPIEARLDMLVEKGFDGIEPDNLDGYEANTGFDITEAETIAFLTWLSDAAHSRGLLIGQKNVPEFSDQFVDSYDFVLTEDAFAQGWEEDVAIYRQQDKPVFMVEYTDESIDYNKACERAKALDYTLLIKRRDLDSWSQDCDG